MKKLKTRFRLKPGEMSAEASEIYFEHGYLWIGGEQGPCYGTLSGDKTLRLFAKNLLKVLNNAR